MSQLKVKAAYCTIVHWYNTSLDVPLVHLQIEDGGVVVDVGADQPQHLVDELLLVLGLEAAHLGHHVVHLHHELNNYKNIHKV